MTQPAVLRWALAVTVLTTTALTAPSVAGATPASVAATPATNNVAPVTPARPTPTTLKGPLKTTSTKTMTSTKKSTSNKKTSNKKTSTKRTTSPAGTATVSTKRPSTTQPAVQPPTTLASRSPATTVTKGTPTTSSPAPVTLAPGGSIQAILATIRLLESGGNYQAQSPRSLASGAYQFKDKTWNGYGGFSRARDAPAAVQDAKASDSIRLTLAANQNDVGSIPVVWYIGHVPAAGSAEWDLIPPNNRVSPRQYQAMWLAAYQGLRTA